ncbi:MAG: hypothetical protein EBR82_79690 [Caulobacteraceae bacterium]|nr:hypothetical protein [Caulobacteraceae bacterium]
MKLIESDDSFCHWKSETNNGVINIEDITFLSRKYKLYRCLKYLIGFIFRADSNIRIELFFRKLLKL